ncbi:hypothetical protein NBRC116601_21030 [Cognatishimia sp. WU-CL00825]
MAPVFHGISGVTKTILSCGSGIEGLSKSEAFGRPHWPPSSPSPDARRSQSKLWRARGRGAFKGEACLGFLSFPDAADSLKRAWPIYTSGGKKSFAASPE